VSRVCGRIGCSSDAGRRGATAMDWSDIPTNL
jgi:hypothetical protein